MAVKFPDPLKNGRGEKNRAISHRWRCSLVKIVILVEGADRSSVAGFTPLHPIFEGGMSEFYLSLLHYYSTLSKVDRPAGGTSKIKIECHECVACRVSVYNICIKLIQTLEQLIAPLFSEAEFLHAGDNDVTDPPKPGDDDATIAKEMLGNIHALDKGLNDNHLAHLHHAPLIPTSQNHTTLTTVEEESED
jgi:hypothetical protein